MKYLKIILFLLLAVMGTQVMKSYDFMVNGIAYNINGVGAETSADITAFYD